MFDPYDAWQKFGIWAGGFTAVFGGMTSSEFLALVGATVAVLSLLLNWWHKRQMVAHDRRMEAIERERLEIQRMAAEGDK